LKSALLKILDSILNKNLWIIYIFLDNKTLREIFLEKYLKNRPEILYRYYSWKPVFFQTNKVLIIKNDAIGDYLLFRNFIKEVHLKSRGKKIFLLGNIIWRDLAETLDSEFIEGFYWLKKGGQNVNPDQNTINELLLEVNSNQYDLVLYPNFSREKLAGDFLIKHIPAKEKVGIHGDFQNQSKADLDVGNMFYSRLMIPEDSVKFEFLRNKEFIEFVFREPSNCNKPEISLQHPTAKIHENPFVILFPGASTPEKQWPKQKFISVAQWLISHYGCEIIIAGGPSDLRLSEELAGEIGQKSMNISGKTSLTELLDWISQCRLIISNDTSAVHMAIQMGIPSICPFKCNHFGRFLPYPEELFPNLVVCLPESVKSYSREKLEKEFSNNYGSDIALVSEEDVKNGVIHLLGATIIPNG